MQRWSFVGGHGDTHGWQSSSTGCLKPAYLSVDADRRGEPAGFSQVKAVTLRSPSSALNDTMRCTAKPAITYKGSPQSALRWTHPLGQSFISPMVPAGSVGDRRTRTSLSSIEREAAMRYSTTLARKN